MFFKVYTSTIGEPVVNFVTNNNNVDVSDASLAYLRDTLVDSVVLIFDTYDFQSLVSLLDEPTFSPFFNFNEFCLKVNLDSRIYPALENMYGTEIANNIFKSILNQIRIPRLTPKELVSMINTFKPGEVFTYSVELEDKSTTVPTKTNKDCYVFIVNIAGTP